MCGGAGYHGEMRWVPCGEVLSTMVGEEGAGYQVSGAAGYHGRGSIRYHQCWETLPWAGLGWAGLL